MTPRTRLAVLVGIIVVAVVGAVSYVVASRRAHQDAVSNAPPVASREDLAAVLATPHIVFRSTALGSNYGFVAAVPIDDAGGPRAFTPAQCERVYTRAQSALCLIADRGMVTTYRAQLLGPDFTPARDLSLTGLPSRARMSPDGSLTATTTFVFGDSYASPGQFSTRTLISRSADGTVIADLEQFTLLVDGRVNDAIDRNIWGVTYVDNNTFFATAASGGVTWLVRGDIAARTLTSLRTDVECPSLSPDGTRIAFKKHGDLPAGRWRLSVYDLRTGQETELAETRSVDDQAEWLDNDHVLYGLPRDQEGSASSDIWVVPADGTGTPAVLIADAWSPAVVR
jgi:hypothetical protein